MQTNGVTPEPTKLVVSSDERFVPFGEMIIMIGEQTNNVKKAQELILSFINPNLETIQINNTVFLVTSTKAESKIVAIGSMINIDAPKNALTNTVEFLHMMQSRGVDIYMSQFKGGNQAQGYNIIGKTFDRFNFDTKISVTQNKKSPGNFQVVVEFGKDSLMQLTKKLANQSRGK